MERRRNIPILIPLVALLGMMILSAACARRSEEQSPVERGKYLAMVGGCGECHSPKVWTPAGPVPDEKRLLSGYPSGARLPEMPGGILGPTQWGAIVTNDMTAWAGAWGVSYSYNLTPDPRTGLGNWSEALFIQSLKTGKFMGTSRSMLPPMPWQAIGRMKDEDLKALFAYLKSIPPIDNAIPEPLPPKQ